MTTDVRPAVGRGLTHRTFLKAMAAALGGAGLGQLAGVRPVDASYTPGPLGDTVDTNLTVQGNLIVTSGPNGAGRAGIGTATPQGALDVTGEIRTNGLIAVGADGRARQCFYADGPISPPPPSSLFGTWGKVATYTWDQIKLHTWSEMGTATGTWERVRTKTWGQLGTNTWSQVQNL